jgi:lactate dehydrogenase-like 2-hydroxyacid dehydrogenase
MAIGQRAEAFHMQVLWHGPRPKPEAPWPYVADLLELARQADFLMVICPLSPATRGLISAEVMAALGPEGTLINIARGAVVDETALVEALQSGRLGAAALDVFEREPQVPEALLALENVVLLPHIGSATLETRAAMGQLMIDNLVAHFDGRPLPTRVA